MLRLKQVLDWKHLTQDACAEYLGISKKTMYNKLSGQSEFSYPEVKKLSELLPEFNIDYLLEDMPETP